ncbi:MAG TPA: endonuclease/exonuclease/phosphatase family protein [Actinomycetota bacterium]|nr:endonuclease/exonuclease/phosphatase family protein [Actinomycetota bacterium]
MGLLLAGLAGCTSGDGGSTGSTSATGSRSSTGSTDAGTEPAAPEAIPLEVFVYNVEYGGDESTDAVIRGVDADIVGVLESYNRLPEIAANTGYPYYNVSLQLLSKYPIHEPSGAEGRYALIEVRPGQVVAFFNIHLDYVKYGPKLLDNGASVDEVLASEDEVRTSVLDEPLRLMGDLIGQGYPVFFTGDHNEPSSLDWTEATAAARPDVDEAIAWPVSEAILGLGFRDTYRDIHPNPVEAPGITHEGAGDRIDYLYAAGPSATLDSRLVGEKGDSGVELGFDPWSSDHRAVVSTFNVTPVPMPIMVSVDRALLTQGDPLTVAYRAPESDGTVTIVPSEADAGSAVATEDVSGSSGAFDVETAGLDPGGYEAVLSGGDGGELARVAFWVRDPNAEIEVSTDRPTYGVGEPIVVSWTDGPANRWDWIGVYEAGKADPKVDYYLIWNYVGLHAAGTVPPSVAGSMTLDETAMGNPWPLPPGRYVVHYLVTDRYRSIGSATFEVGG